MVRLERTVGPKGQVVIPEAIRRAKGIWPGTTVMIDIDRDKIILEPKKINIVDWLEQEVKKHGKKLGKIDWDKSYEEDIEERARHAGIGLPRR